AGPRVDVEDSLVFRIEDEDGIVSVLENPAVVLARLAQLAGALLDQPGELVMGAAQLGLRPLQLGRPDGEEVRAGEPGPALLVVLRGQREEVDEEGQDPEALPAVGLPGGLAG